MSVYYLKPIVWNTESYLRPSGWPFTSGYPMENGYGHEEWNNVPEFTFEEMNKKYRVFHSEGLGKQSLDDFAGEIFVFMIASHNGNQYLVGVAGGAKSLHSDQHREMRERLVKRLSINERWQEAWAINNVQDCYSHDQKNFLKHWKTDLHWIPNWICPAHLFLWLNEPYLIDPKKINGSKRVITMYSSYQKINRRNALDILNNIDRLNNDSDILKNLITLCSTDELDAITDIHQIENSNSLDITTKESLIQARVGQGKFRQDLMKIWNSCAITGSSVPELLRASHIKPWRDSTNKERLDPNNGLLLEANLDVLFDSGLIAFEDDGVMLVSAKLSETERERLRIPSRLRISPNQELCKYLSYHRINVFSNQ